ncbi:MFS transporter [Pelagibius litoralis]|uniref:MFS transporter n=1 Tax=Pelagibius litoralis TaxID=374515 RepID=A0A967C478_9PROT|nr:MFS transporter [Pelagibius litoralis]NIA68274.1 MFS transporter [Pelagibius litoralis]
MALTGWRLVALLCLTQVLGMLGNATFPALIPVFQPLWALSNTEAGWVSGVYYAGYTAAVPVLVTLTDRQDARGIYLLSCLLGGLAALGFALLASGFWTAMVFRFLGGIGLAGTYMVGLKLLSDRLPEQGRARSVAIYTAHFGIGASLSVFAAGEVTALAGWSWAFVVGALGSFVSLLLVVVFVRPLAPRPRRAAPTAVFDFRPVLRNRPALAYTLGYAAHIWELFGFRAWLVAFLVFVFAQQPALAAGGWSPTQVATLLLLLGLPASILGNEIATAFGRRRIVSLFMIGSGGIALVLGFIAGAPLWLLVAVLLVYGCLIMADSGALTAGAVIAAAPERRGATMALHALLGFGAGFLSPLAFGVVLDLGGGVDQGLAWGFAFALLGLGVFTGPLILALLARRGNA